ncbi:metal ABC transporter permease [Oceanithermus desulfurans]|uniref:Manganese transporter n=3 Tax=Oceanithermus TaxID=208447 RepID=A0A511RKK8_9DEIN|nr:metal ABC transporter permease [Oceanithermus desulfurans]MBB6029565.1 zinc transport system permease protein [Oceanithermus desulfurans]GEM90201.1 manganese transporter [Oceanithermus desulfurans NBRC 100063]HHO58480.1 metal ABC transporter permease [Oceanithermus profundus]
MLEVWSLPFMQRALLAGLVMALLAGYYGPFVVQRGLSFLGSGLAHAAFGGVALGLLLGLEPLWVAVPFTAAVALGITWVRERTHIRGDTAVGIFFAFSMALGIVFLSLKREYTAEAFTYLFGSILAVAPADLWASLALLALTALTLPLWGRWAYATFDRELAAADRVPVALDDYLLAFLVALVVVVAMKLVGLLLVAAFLVIPAAAARQWARTFLGMVVGAVFVGVFSVFAGLLLSYGYDLPSGATVVLLQAFVFTAAALLFRRAS